LTDHDVEHFRDHPREISQLSPPVNVQKYFFSIGTSMDTILVGFFKILKDFVAREAVLRI
jgi:hypothetical protein